MSENLQKMSNSQIRRETSRKMNQYRKNVKNVPISQSIANRFQEISTAKSKIILQESSKNPPRILNECPRERQRPTEDWEESDRFQLMNETFTAVGCKCYLSSFMAFCHRHFISIWALCTCLPVLIRFPFIFPPPLSLLRLLPFFLSSFLPFFLSSFLSSHVSMFVAYSSACA